MFIIKFPTPVISLQPIPDPTFVHKPMNFCFFLVICSVNLSRDAIRQRSFQKKPLLEKMVEKIVDFLTIVYSPEAPSQLSLCTKASATLTLTFASAYL